MSDLTLQKLRPIIRNERRFSKKEVAFHVVRLGYTKSRHEALDIADSLVRADHSEGRLERVGGAKAGLYAFRRAGRPSAGMEAMFHLLLQTQIKLARAEETINQLKGQSHAV